MMERLRDRRDDTAALLEQAAEIREAHGASEARVWRRLERSVRVPSGSRRWMFIGLLAPAAVALLLHVRTPSPAPQAPIARAPALQVPGVGSLRPGVGARIRTERAAGDGLVFLDEGELTAEIVPRPAGKPLIVVTPQLRVVVVGTRFRVAAAGGRTEVSVEEGRVRVEAGSAVVLLAPGERVSSDDPRLQPAPPVVDALAEENALFARARAAEHDGDAAHAFELYTEHGRRFPTGVLAPERAAALAHGHLAEQRCAQASAQLVILAALNADDPRLPELRTALRRCEAK